MNKKHFLKSLLAITLLFGVGILLLYVIAYHGNAEADMTLSERIQSIQGR